MDRLIETLEDLRDNPLAFAGAAANASADEARSIEREISRLREKLQGRELHYLDLLLRGYGPEQIEAVTGDAIVSQEIMRDAIRRVAVRLAANERSPDSPAA